MAPAKPPASYVVAKSLATSLSSPVSLLWAHQLRREHSVLLGRIEDLASAFGNVSEAKLSQAMGYATGAQKKSAKIESELASIKKTLHQAGEQEKSLVDQIVGVCARLDVSEEGILALQMSVRTVEEGLQKSLIDRLATVEQNLQHHQEEREQQVQELKAHVGDLQTRLPDIVRGGVIGIRDSMEETVEHINQTAERTLYPASPGIKALPASGLVQRDSEQVRNFLTLRPKVKILANHHRRGDIDLDENLLTPDPEADVAGQTLSGKVMAMLPELPNTNSHHHKELSSLKQGKFQSWDLYFAAGEVLINSLPKRKEGAVVDAFVDGIYDDKLRGNFEKALDELRWSWKSVKHLVKGSVTIEPETQPMQRTESVAHKHKKGEICPVCSKKANVSQSPKISIETANGSPQRSMQQSSQRSLTADPRRSQRILQQNQPSPVRGKIVLNPNPQTSRAPQYDNAFEGVPQGISAQKAVLREARPNVETTKEKPAVTGLGAPILIGNGRTLAMPRDAVQERNLEVVRQDPRIRAERTAPELPRYNKRAPLQETRPPSPPKLQPITVMNHTKHQDISIVAHNDWDVTSDVPEVPEKQSSRKRKLIEQLELPDTAERDVVTAPHKAITYSKAREQQGEKRRKRAVLPIPLIPVLPLSDDE